MKKQTLAALKKSIKKWKKVADGALEEQGWTNCPLCLLFYNEDCMGCPVQERTNRTACNSTPYVEWAKSGYTGQTATTPKMTTIALKEVTFLKSLLPTKE